MRRVLVCLAVSCVGTCLATLSARAADEPAKASTRGGSSLPIHDGVLELSLDEAVGLAIDRNLDVEILRFEPEIAAKDYGAAWGAYDPQIYGEGGYEQIENPTANIIFGESGIIADETWSGEAGLRGQIPWLGGSYQAGYFSSELKTTSPISVLSPEFRSGFLAALTVPLLKGLFWSDSWTQVRLARVGVDLSAEQFHSQLMDVVQRTEDAYWALIAAQDDRVVSEKSLETARALLDQTQAQFEVGVVSKVEVVQAEAGVADREFVLIRSQAVERNSQDALIDVVLGPYLEPETDLRVVATDRPEVITVREVSTVAATERALARRPELAVARKDIELRKIQESKASNDRLPQLDVVGTYSQSGLAGRVSPNCQGRTVLNPAATGISDLFLTSPCTSGAERFWTDADDDFFAPESGKSYSVVGVLSIPLGNTAARNLHQRSQLELRRSETQLRRLEQSIVSEIRRAARNLEASLEGIEAARRAEAAAAEQLRAERVRLEHGESTPFDVLLREEDLVRAQAQKIFAEQTYQTSISALDRAQGTILERHQIVVEEAAALR
jgi:outer membrane protein TolC